MPDAPKTLKGYFNFLIDKEIIQLSNQFNLISPLEEKNLSGNSYDLRVGNMLTSRNHSSTFDISKDSYAIESGEVVTISTMENINFLNILCSGIICNKHSILARGLFHPITTIDPGFNETLAVTFINLGNTRYKLNHGDKIAKLFVSPLKKIPQNIYGENQRPSYREGSLEIATIFDNPIKHDDPEMYTKMYGEPIKHLYGRIENIERELSIADIKKDYKQRTEFRTSFKNIIYALVSGVSGALLAIYWKNILLFLKSLF